MTRTLPTKLIAGALAVASLGMAALGTVGSADAEAKSRPAGASLSIQTEEVGFSGFIISRNESCQNDRKIILMRQRNKKRSLKKDRKIGSDFATPNGDGAQWFVNTDETGKFYAYAKATKHCKRALSPVVRRDG
jgi:hypothetical protein